MCVGATTPVKENMKYVVFDGQIEIKQKHVNYNCLTHQQKIERTKKINKQEKPQCGRRVVRTCAKPVYITTRIKRSLNDLVWGGHSCHLHPPDLLKQGHPQSLVNIVLEV